MKYHGIIVLIYSVILLSYSSNLHAQNIKDTTNASNWTFGIQGGFNLVKLDGELPTIENENTEVQISEIDNLFTASIGAVAEYHFTNKASVQLSLLYMRAGSIVEEHSYVKNEIGIIDVHQVYNYYLDYFSLPILMRYYIKDFVYLEGGVYSSFLFSSSSTRDNMFEQDYDILENKVFDAGATAGIGFVLSPWKIGFRYNYGLLPSVKYEDNYLKNRVVQFYFALNINKK